MIHVRRSPPPPPPPPPRTIPRRRRRRRSASSSSDSRSGDRAYSKQAPGRILYRVEWTDDKSRRRQNFESEIPFSSLQVAKSNVDYEDAVVDDESDKPALVVITPFSGVGPLQPVTLADSTLSEPTSPLTDLSEEFDRRRLWESKDVAYDDIEITSVEKSKIIIYSPVLLKALRDVIHYYPGRSFTSSHIQIAEPYVVLVQHFDALQSLHRRLSEKGNQTDDDAKTPGNENDACKHVELLLDYLQGYMRPRIEPARSRLLGPEPMVTFADLWLLFKPGTDVYMRMKPEHFSSTVAAGVVMEVEEDLYDPDRDRDLDDEIATRVTFWNLQSDGEHYGRNRGTRYIEWYEGVRRVTSLPIFPCFYRDREDGGKSRAELERRGQKTFEISRAQPKQMFYNGYQLGVRKQWVT